MISRKELIQTDEYWKEILSNSLWRARMQSTTVAKEERYLIRKIKELKKVLKEVKRKDSDKLFCPECGCNKVYLGDVYYACRNKDCEHLWAK